MDVEELQRRLVAGGGVVTRDETSLAGSLDWLLRTGRLVAVLPGAYSTPELSTRPLVRMRAACRVHANAVLVGAAAAHVTFWPGVPVPVVEAAVPVGLRPQPGFGWQRRRIPPELVRQDRGLRCTDPALTALELADRDDGSAIDLALRTRTATLDGMHEALRLTRSRPGNRARAQLLLDSRDEPWSAAERRAHRLLRGAGIGGWTGNLAVHLDGRLYYLDIGFARLKLVVEIDGRIHERDLELFESDRWRQNALVRHGWRVLRFTWSMLVDHPDVFVAEVRAALKMQTQTLM